MIFRGLGHSPGTHAGGGCGGGALQVPGDTPVKAIKFAITEPSSGSEASGPLHAGVPHMPWA